VTGGTIIVQFLLRREKPGQEYSCAHQEMEYPGRKYRALAMDRALQEYKKSLQEELKGVDARIDESKKEIEQRTVYSGSHRA